MLTQTRPRQGIATLRRFVRAQPVDICEVCGTGIPGHHGHIVEPATRRVLCACLICGEALTGRIDGRYRRVPERAEPLPGLRLSDAAWRSLGLPIDMAFIFHSTPDERPVALYPGPLGATQSLLSLDAWSALVADNPVLDKLEPDVEALLVNRISGRRGYYRVPIDRCYALVGLIRTRWQGLSGGDEVWQAIDDFMARLDDRREPAR